MAIKTYKATIEITVDLPDFPPKNTFEAAQRACEEQVVLDLTDEREETDPSVVGAMINWRTLKEAKSNGS